MEVNNKPPRVLNPTTPSPAESPTLKSMRSELNRGSNTRIIMTGKEVPKA